jgi:hypothetical protein
MLLELVLYSFQVHTKDLIAVRVDFPLLLTEASSSK